MATEKVNILLNARNSASQVIRTVQRDLGALDKAAGMLAGGFAALGAAAGVGMLTGMALDAAKAAIEFGKLERAFDNLASNAGQSSKAMLSAMRSASQGMISDAELVQSANRAMMLGVADTGDEMAQLIEVAMKRGQAMGLSTAQAFNDIVTGIGRMSPLILDNLGIVTGGEKVFTDYAASIGKAASALSDAEKKQALLNMAVATSQDIAMPLVDDMERMKASIANAKIAMGNLISPAVVGMANDIANAAERINDALNGGLAGQRDAFRSQIDAMAAAGTIDSADIARMVQGLESATVAAAQATGGLSSLKAGVTATGDKVLNLGQAESQASVATQRLGNDFVSITGGLSHFNQNLAITAGNVVNLTSVMAGFSSTINSISSGLVADLGVGGAVKYARDLTSEARHQAFLWEQAGYSMEEIQGILMPAYLADARKANQEIGTMGAGMSSVNSEYSKLESTISGIISSAIGPVAGVNADDLLPRPDAVNENARRLADIATKGIFGQSWLEEFKSEVPGIWAEIESSGDPQGTAARILKDFQDGLRPELIDKGRAKELAKRALLGDQNAQALAKEIAGELAAEMGVSLQAAQAATSAALGVDAGGGTGKVIKPTIDMSGIDSAAIGAQVQAAFASITVTPAWDLSAFDTAVESLSGTMVHPQIVNPSGENIANVRTFITETMPIVLTPQMTAPAPTEVEKIGLLITDKLYAGMAVTEGLPTIQLPFTTFSLPSNIGYTLIQVLGAQLTSAVTGGESGYSPLQPVGTTIAMKLMDSVRSGFVTAQTGGGDNMMAALSQLFATGFMLGIDSSTIGADVAGAIHLQISQSFSLIENSGVGAGQRWRTGFMAEITNIPGDVLRTLAMLVTPYVVATQAAQAGQTGAAGE